MNIADYQRVLHHVLSGGHFQPLLRSPQRAQLRDEWRAFINEHARRPPSSSTDAERFHDQWHVCHHYVRELVDDEPAVIDMLRVWLPPYQGPGLTLYRGENIDRMRAHRIGLAWTDEKETALVFARGLNALGQGGALLRTHAPASAIIAGPSKHSRYLGESEFTVDPRRLSRLETLERFPPPH